MNEFPKFVIPEQKFYAHYDKVTGELLCIGNRRYDDYEHAIEISFKVAEPFILGHHKFFDHIIDYVKIEDELVPAIVPKNVQGMVINKNLFEYIEPNDSAECLVSWMAKSQVWEFSLSTNYRQRMKGKSLYNKVVFFVTLETDFDFLIRTIDIDMRELLGRDLVQIPFIETIENEIDKISISSKSIFESYGLRILHDQ